MASLQDQLLKAGIIDQKKAKKIKQEKRKQAKQQPKGKAVVNEAREQAKRNLAQKTDRDREINLQHQAEADKKAIRAQISQLISSNQIDRQGGEVSYQFPDGKKIKKIYVTSKLQNQLSKGQIGIAKLDQSYALVPAVVAEKIQQRDERTIVMLNSNTKSEVDDDDPYADYQIPDDLMW
ncbi:MAG: DUF2058 domain-containing protein [Halieaceae bacterium]|nr:DUF2058 domain-containing protein [Halieaceae bacterium]